MNWYKGIPFEVGQRWRDVNTGIIYEVVGIGFLNYGYCKVISESGCITYLNKSEILCGLIRLILDGNKND